MESMSFRSYDGQQVILFRMHGRDGFFIEVLNIGIALNKVMVPDQKGNLTDVVLGFDTPETYAQDASYIGVICGRYANRIGNASFRLGNHEYKVSPNSGKHCLHGGYKGFNRKIWEAHPEPGQEAVVFTYLSPDGEEGFPGNLKVAVRVSVTERNEIVFDYKAETDRMTVVNLTNHSYFNLTGAKENVVNHLLWINASSITENDSELIPTGRILPVTGTEFDFRKSVKVKREDFPFKGYDNNFILDEPGLSKPSALVINPETGLALEMKTTEPAVQLYTANHFDGSQVGKKNIRYNQFWGLCLEAQHYPDSPNHPEFPSVVLQPGDTYKQTTIYRFYQVQ